MGPGSVRYPLRSRCRLGRCFTSTASSVIALAILKARLNWVFGDPSDAPDGLCAAEAGVEYLLALARRHGVRIRCREARRCGFRRTETGPHPVLYGYDWQHPAWWRKGVWRAAQ